MTVSHYLCELWGFEACSLCCTESSLTTQTFPQTQPLLAFLNDNINLKELFIIIFDILT